MLAFKPITMQYKIIAAIAAYLEKVTTKDSNGFLNQFTWGHTSKIHATEIAAAIAPLVEAGESPTKFEKDNLPLDVKLLFHKGVRLYQCIQNYELGILTSDEFIGDIRKVESDLA